VAGAGHVLAEHGGTGQKQRDPERGQADELHGRARGARRLTEPRVAIPPIAPDAFHRRDPGAQVARLRGEALGTDWSALIVAPPPEAREALLAALDSAVMAMSQWEPRSALSRVNAASIGEWVEAPAPLADTLAAALAIHAASGGSFHPAAGRLSELWGFGVSGPRPFVPTAEQVAGARPNGLGFELEGRRIRRTGDVALDLSGIGKGQAVDMLAGALASLGCRDFLVEIGGEFVGRGVMPDGQPWWVELEDPPGVTLPPFRIACHGVAIATSGDYRRFIVSHEGRRLGHSVDPRTGWPVANGVVSVSVVADSCTRADGWATALTVLGRDQGLRIAKEHGLAARIVTNDGVEALSPALQAMLD
jgi:thiamine biosynthesis lipoprotein